MERVTPDTEAVTLEQFARLVEGRTLVTNFRDTVRAYPDQQALRWKQSGEWHGMTYAEYADQASRAAAGLARLGVARGQRVALMLRQRPEFCIIDMGALMIGATPVSIYNSSSPEQIADLLRRAEAQVAVVDDTEFLDRLLKVRAEFPQLRHVICLDDPQGVVRGDVLSFGDLVGSEKVDLEVAAATVTPQDMATIIFTSGTSGPPKGVQLSHRNLAAAAESANISHGVHERQGRRIIAYLPMAHIGERLNGYCVAIRRHDTVHLCPDPQQVGAYLFEVRPGMFFGVPRIWEKLWAVIQHAVMSAPAEQQAEYESALAVGRQVAPLRGMALTVPDELVARYQSAEPVLRGLRAKVALEDMQVAVTAAAAISRDVLLGLGSVGVILGDGYGMSEGVPITDGYVHSRWGTSGRPAPGIELKLADDGEILIRGLQVFEGYLDPEQTAEAKDADGWFATGDIGKLDEDGYLTIIDRKKELIITAYGKNISPANLEIALVEHPLIAQACVIGEGRPYVAALVVLDPLVAPEWGRQQGIELDTLAEYARHVGIIAEIDRHIAEVNQRFSQVEHVKKAVVLDNEWRPDSDELTPTMKIKRHAVHKKYVVQIEALYSNPSVEGAAICVIVAPPDAA